MEAFPEAYEVDDDASHADYSENDDDYVSDGDFDAAAIDQGGDGTVADDTATRSRKRKTRDEEDENVGGLGIHMVISQEERQWALALKEAVQEGEDTKDISLSDMMLAQYAIVERGDIGKALDRIRRMNEFLTTYQIENTAEHGVQCIKEFMEQQPGMSLNLDQCARHKHYVHVMDMAKFNPRKVDLPRDWKVFLSGIHYFISAMNPTLSAVRNGGLFILECDGMGWHNFSIDFERRMWHEHVGAYPVRFHELSWVRTPLVANVFFSLMKPIFPEEVRRVVHLGVKFDESFDGRLDDLFLQPSVEIANQRQLMTAQAFLETRYHNEKHFSL